MILLSGIFLGGILPSLQTERIESLKAGIIAALSFAVADLSLILINTLSLTQWQQLAQIQAFWDIALLVRVAIGGMSGFLFGVTYRYIVRSDRNSHLKDGAVLAFSIVRGLALLEKTVITADQLWFWLILAVESIICFAIARLTLDLALELKLLKPFQ